MIVRVLALIVLTSVVPFGASAQFAHATAPSHTGVRAHPAAPVAHATAPVQAPSHAVTPRAVAHKPGVAHRSVVTHAATPAVAPEHTASAVVHGEQEPATTPHAPVAAQPAAAGEAIGSKVQVEHTQERVVAKRERVDARDQERAQAKRERIVEKVVERHSKGVNVRIDATVIESKGEEVTGRKVLSVTTLDGGDWSSVRSTQNVRVRFNNVVSYRAAPLNMDARAFLREDGRIRVELTVEYGAGHPAEGPVAADDNAMEGNIKQSVSAVLESGKPLMLAQSADATGDRRVALEVKATVLK
jgi:hypothetical protein